MPQPIRLCQLGIIRLSGPDTRDFLQGICTCDMRVVSLTQASPGAFCNQSGRVIAYGIIGQTENNVFEIILEKSLIIALVKHLKHYQLRRKTTISTISSPLTGTIDQEGSNQKDAWQVTDHAIQMDNHRTIFIGQDDLDNALDEVNKVNNLDDWASWLWHDIQQMTPIITAETSGLFTVHALGYHNSNAISFNKGCYLGQEIIARTQNLGTPKKQLVRLHHSVMQLPGGCPCIDAEQKNVGTIIISAQHESLAVISRSALAKPLFVTHNSKSLAVEIVS